MPNRFTALRGPWAPLFVLAVVVSIVLGSSTGTFFTSANGYVIFSNAALLCVIGFAQLAVLSVGEFSLAVAGIGNLSGVIAGGLMVTASVPVPIAVAVAVLAGAVAGLLNGLIITRIGVGGFIVTLATGDAFSGLALGLTHTSPFTGLPSSFTTFGTGRAGFLPFLALATIVVALALWLYYRYSRVGRAMLAVGGNREAAELSGMSPRRSVLLAHVLSGGLAAVAGVMAAAQLHQADPLMATNWLIESFTVAIVGGTLLTGGVVSIAGVVVSGIVLAMISDILILLNVNAYWVTLIQGALVFIAVMIGRATVWPALLRAIRLPVRS